MTFSHRGAQCSGDRVCGHENGPDSKLKDGADFIFFPIEFSISGELLSGLLDFIVRSWFLRKKNFFIFSERFDLEFDVVILLSMEKRT